MMGKDQTTVDAHFYTNFMPQERLSVYEAAIAETGIPIWLGEPKAPHREGAMGLWSEERMDLSKFWRVVERIDMESANAK